MPFTCADCGERFLSKIEYNNHKQRHLQTHIDKWTTNDKTERRNDDIPEALNRELWKVFAKYRIDDNKLFYVFGSKRMKSSMLLCVPLDMS
ncbi:MAG: hypothetical protein WAM42_06940 [Candidatus Nitrosopolaris sp.]